MNDNDKLIEELNSQISMQERIISNEQLKLYHLRKQLDAAQLANDEIRQYLDQYVEISHNGHHRKYYMFINNITVNDWSDKINYNLNGYGACLDKNGILDIFYTHYYDCDDVTIRILSKDEFENIFKRMAEQTLINVKNTITK